MKRFWIFIFFLLFTQHSLSAQITQKAIFAGGCFWCIEHDFDKIKGVIQTTSGFCGGVQPNPTYSEVSKGTTGYVESVLVDFDPEEILYSELVSAYWRMIDPTRNDGQFCDKGPQYRPVIFYLNEEQKHIAEQSKDKVIQSSKLQPFLVEITEATKFYPAEEYHQNYAKKHPFKYFLYRWRCGRDARLKELWRH